MDIQTWLQGKKTYIVLALAAFLTAAKNAGVDLGAMTAESVYPTVELFLLGLAALFKQAGETRAALAKKDLTIMRLAKDV